MELIITNVPNTAKSVGKRKR